MANIRRIYIFVVAAVSLNAVAWAVIALLRNLLTSLFYPAERVISYQTEMIALQLAVIVIGLPIYLVHWLWAGRLARANAEEQAAWLRRFYLYVMMSAFVIPIITNAMGMLQAVLRPLLGVRPVVQAWETSLPDGLVVLATAVAMVVLAALWAYHHWVALWDRSQVPENDGLALIHRLYVYFFSFVSLVMLTTGGGSVLRWVMLQFGGSAITEGRLALAESLAPLLIGLAFWLYFWQKAEKMFTFGGVREQESVERKFYLYLVIFLSALAVVGSLTTILAGLFKQLLDVSSGGDIRNILAVLGVAAVVWGYHAWVLRRDSLVQPEATGQATVRRLYWYLIAGLGLTALIVGIGGNLSVLIGAASDAITYSSREQAAWFTAVLLAGLAVWIIPWANIQSELNLPGEIGVAAHQTLLRRIYLYLFLLIATLTFLGCGIYVVSQLIYLLLGGRSSATLLPDVAQALAYALMAVAVWLYHGKLLRTDMRVAQETEQQLAKTVHVAVVDDEDGRFGQLLIQALHQAIPNAILHPVGLTLAANETLHTADDPMPAQQILSTAQIVVGPWTMATPYVLHGETDMAMLAAVSASPGRKLLIAKPEAGWEWAGLGAWNVDTAVKQACKAVKQLIVGETVQTKRHSLGAILGAIFFIFVLLNLLPLLISVPLRYMFGW